MSGKPFAHVIGDPIAQSKSPLIHGFWLEKLGSDALYTVQRVPEGGLGAYIDRVSQDPDWRGTNVTMPLKHEALERADVAHSTARRIGASNTLVPGGASTSAQIGAFNTDAEGFLEPLREELSKKHYFRMARILGTGGAARAITRMVEEHLYFAIVADRWLEDDNWAHIKARFFNEIPLPVRGLISSMARRHARRNLQGQGIALHTPSERFDRVRRDVIAVSDVLGDKPFLFGETACSADYSVVPMLRAAIVTPIEKPLGRFIKSDPGLMAYVSRFMDAYYP